MKWNRRITWRLTLHTVLVCGVVLLLAAGGLLAYETFAYRDRAVHEATKLGKVAAGSLSAVLAFRDDAGAHERLAPLTEHGDVLAVGLFSADGSRFVGFSRGDASVPESIGDETNAPPRFEGAELVLTLPVQSRMESIGYLYLRQDVREQRARALAYMRIGLVSALALLGLAWLLAARLQRSITEPIRALSQLADQITQKHDYSVRARSTTADELGALVRAFNEMLAEIESRQTRLRQSEQQSRQLAAIVESSHEAIFSTDRDGVVVSWNEGATRSYGYPAGDAIGRHLSTLFPRDFSTELSSAWSKAQQGERAENIETVLRRQDESAVEMAFTISPIRDAAGAVTGVAAVGRDIGPRKQLERELLESSDNERRRIGHDLHDGLGQLLAGIALKTQAMQEALAAEVSSQVEESREIVQLMNDSIRQTRMHARGLDPVEAEANGLTAALQSLAAQTEYLFRIECTCHSTVGRLAVDAPTGLALYRIAQEAIHNAVNHGRARAIQMTLTKDDGPICLRVQDQGCGFDPAKVTGPGIGLRIMRYRANSISARLTLDSSIGAGTVVECTLMLAQGRRQSGEQATGA